MRSVSKIYTRTLFKEIKRLTKLTIFFLKMLAYKTKIFELKLND